MALNDIFQGRMSCAALQRALMANFSSFRSVTSLMLSPILTALSLSASVSLLVAAVELPMFEELNSLRVRWGEPGLWISLKPLAVTHPPSPMEVRS
jgi:hypothetical protein